MIHENLGISQRVYRVKLLDSLDITGYPIGPDSGRRGNGQKPPRTMPSRQKSQKDHLTKPPDKNPCKQLRENLYRGLLSGFFVLRLLKLISPRCVTYFGVGPRAVADPGGANPAMAPPSKLAM